MTEWMNIIDLTDVWKYGEATLEDIPAISKKIINGLQNLQGCEMFEDEIEELIESFQYYIENKCESFDEFNYEMDNLYNLGDLPVYNSFPDPKVAWIKTF